MVFFSTPKNPQWISRRQISVFRIPRIYSYEGDTSWKSHFRCPLFSEKSWREIICQAMQLLRSDDIRCYEIASRWPNIKNDVWAITQNWLCRKMQLSYLAFRWMVSLIEFIVDSGDYHRRSCLLFFQRLVNPFLAANTLIQWSHQGDVILGTGLVGLVMTRESVDLSDSWM